MPVSLPVTAAGERFVTVNTGTQVLIFRTYFVCGQDSHWLLDIRDAQDKPLISGINLVPGVDNLLKGRGDVLHGCQLRVSVKHGLEKKTESLGKSMELIWYGLEEMNPATPLDPMETIGTIPWWTEG